MVRTTLGQAKAEYGDRLRAGPLGAILQGEEYRIIHDATHVVGVNAHLQLATRATAQMI